MWVERTGRMKGSKAFFTARIGTSFSRNKKFTHPYKNHTNNATIST